MDLVEWLCAELYTWVCFEIWEVDLLNNDYVEDNSWMWLKYEENFEWLCTTREMNGFCLIYAKNCY